LQPDSRTKESENFGKNPLEKKANKSYFEIRRKILLELLLTTMAKSRKMMAQKGGD
jgi:hypothetical protein